MIRCWCMAAMMLLTTMTGSFGVFRYGEPSSMIGYEAVRCFRVDYAGAPMNNVGVFNDKNAVQLKAAQRYGLREVAESRTEVARHFDEMVKIGTCENYLLCQLDYSVPYLMPNASAELDTIGAKFRRALAKHGLPQYRIEVTSVLRTREDVRNLISSGNKNATMRSCHCYGTTFDIGYDHYDKRQLSLKYSTPDDLTKVLAEVLYEERRAGRIYVKYELGETCFHITVRR